MSAFIEIFSTTDEISQSMQRHTDSATQLVVPESVRFSRFRLFNATHTGPLAAHLGDKCTTTQLQQAKSTGTDCIGTSQLGVTGVKFVRKQRDPTATLCATGASGHHRGTP